MLADAEARLAQAPEDFELVAMTGEHMRELLRKAEAVLFQVLKNGHTRVETLLMLAGLVHFAQLLDGVTDEAIDHTLADIRRQIAPLIKMGPVHLKEGIATPSQN